MLVTSVLDTTVCNIKESLTASIFLQEALMYTLIISSLYPDTVTDHQMLNEEVQIDSQTVKDLFDDTLELLVPAGSLTKGQLLSLKADLYLLITPLKINQETAVNIVLNTHGTPGKHDIDISFIFELVQQLSAEHIRIKDRKSVV